LEKDKVGLQVAARQKEVVAAHKGPRRIVVVGTAIGNTIAKKHEGDTRSAGIQQVFNHLKWRIGEREKGFCGLVPFQVPKGLARSDPWWIDRGWLCLHGWRKHP
jgi:hypothetical protein